MKHMKNKTFGYVRVSDKRKQREDRQLDELLAYGIDERDIFIEKQSGKDFDRPKYQALKQMLREGDLLIVKSLDRFGRNKNEISQEWYEITKEIGAHIKVLDMPLLDTTVHKDYLGTFVSDLVLQVLGFVAETERANMIDRIKSGIAAQKARGTYNGGRPKVNLNTLSDEQKQCIKENYPRWEAEEITAVEFMNKLGVKKTSFYKLMKECEEQLYNKNA
jgi:DNA invertase Pin-like site-specific DNA recombinase